MIDRSSVPGYSFGCKDDKCGIGWRRENTLLQRLHLAPPTVIDCSVGFKGGVASSVYIAVAVAGHDSNGHWRDERGVVVQQNTEGKESCNPHYRISVRKREVTGETYWGTVAMDGCVLTQDKARAMAVNTSCLTRIGGCKTLEDMLPEISWSTEAASQ